MGFVIPTLSNLIARTQADLNARMGNSNALIRRSLPWALSYVIGAVVWGAYLYQSYIARMAIPDTAEDEYLDRWGRIWLKYSPRLAAVKATGTVVVTGATGAVVAAFVKLQRADAVEYVTTGGPYVWAAPGTKDVTVEAVVAGAAGNYPYTAEARLSFVSPPAGIVAEVPLKAPNGIDAGADIESDDSFRDRMLSRIGDPPQGGAKADYVAWAQAAHPTVRIVWVQAYPDPGLAADAVKVFFIVDGTGAAVIPAAGVVAAVSAYLLDDARKPVTAKVTVAAPGPRAQTLSLTVHLEDGADLAAMKAAVLDELESMYRDRVQVASGGFTVPNSYLHDAIGAAKGVDWYTITAVNGGAGTSDLVFAPNEYPTLVPAGITWNIV